MPTPLTRVTVSAGGIVLNRQGLVLLVNQRGTSWSFPKGHVEPGEEPVSAATREIMEESGITRLKILEILGAYGRYRIGKVRGDDKTEWKIILFFLFKTGQSALNFKSPEHPEARWVHPDKVAALLTHPKDKVFYKKFYNRINETA
jgi:diadenosine hexaphosphate hydrolase (ATP-forming)